MNIKATCFCVIIVSCNRKRIYYGLDRCCSDSQLFLFSALITPGQKKCTQYSWATVYRFETVPKVHSFCVHPCNKFCGNFVILIYWNIFGIKIFSSILRLSCSRFVQNSAIKMESRKDIEIKCLRIARE